MDKKLAVFIALALSCPLLVSADDTTTRVRMSDADQLPYRKTIDQASEVFSAITKGPHGEVPANVLRSARCIVVIPDVITGAVVIGGTHGNGVASCRTTGNGWSDPAPVALNQASIGLQAGAKSADLVLFLQSNAAEQALKRGNFEIGADVSAVAGKYDSSVDTSKAGVVAFSRSEGLFAGASVTGGKISKDEDRLASYYGKTANFTAMLEGREPRESSEYTQKLTKLFPNMG